MTHDSIYDFLYYGSQFFTTFFVLGVASAILDSERGDDDDDDEDGGTLIPCYIKR